MDNLPHKYIYFRKFVYTDTKNTLNSSSKSISLRTFLGPLGDFIYIYSLALLKSYDGRGVKKWGILILKNTQFFDIKGKMGVVSHICIYKLNTLSLVTDRKFFGIFF
jgi:hypothetical protein